MSDNPYDNIPYFSQAHPQTHPDRLASLATLFGMTPRPIDQCRILELGCGDGGNMIPMACNLPRSELVGVDYSSMAIDKGRDTVTSLGLKNIELLNMDLMDLGAEAGLFDYIICHGVFSWITKELRDKVMQICQTNLAPQGVAFVSYNVYPGGHMRGMARDILRYHANNFQEPEVRLSQARGILKFVSEAVPRSASEYGTILSKELDRIMQLPPPLQWNYVFHDHLEEINTSFLFHEFIDLAGRNNLAFLAEADFFEMQDHMLPPEVCQTIQNLAGANILVKEQLLDFIKGRYFRQTCLCHEGTVLNRCIHPGIVNKFYLSSRSKPVDEEGNILEGEIPDLLTRPNLHFRKPPDSHF